MNTKDPATLRAIAEVASNASTATYLMLNGVADRVDPITRERIVSAATRNEELAATLRKQAEDLESD